MTLFHFAYGSNMSRAPTSGRCPGAQALGTANAPPAGVLRYQSGSVSVRSRRGQARTQTASCGRLTARDFAAINAYESVDAGLYLRRRLMVRQGGRGSSAITYIARWKGEGTPRPGYIALVVDAARDWKLPNGPFVRLRVGRRQDGAERAPGTRGNWDDL